MFNNSVKIIFGLFIISIIIFINLLIRFITIENIKKDAEIIKIFINTRGNIQRLIKFELNDIHRDDIIEELDKKTSYLLIYSDNLIKKHIVKNNEIFNNEYNFSKSWSNLKNIIYIYRKNKTIDLKEKILEESEVLWPETSFAVF